MPDRALVVELFFFASEYQDVPSSSVARASNFKEAFARAYDRPDVFAFRLGAVPLGKEGRPLYHKACFDAEPLNFLGRVERAKDAAGRSVIAARGGIQISVHPSDNYAVYDAVSKTPVLLERFPPQPPCCSSRLCRPAMDTSHVFPLPQCG